MTINSRAKGKRGELAARDELRRHGFECDRDGRRDGDLKHNIPGVHIEVKAQNRWEMWSYINQAKRDAGEKNWAVMFKRDRTEWFWCESAETRLAEKAELLRLRELTNQPQEGMHGSKGAASE